MKKTYIQKGSDAKKDIFATYGIMTKSIPEPQLESKEFFKRDWAERQGDEEYIPATPMFKAYEQDMEFAYKGTLNTARAAIRTFLTYIQGSEFSLYDEYTQRGIRCRFISYDPKAFHRQDLDMVVFNIKVKINNPLCYAITATGVTISTTANSATTVYWDDGATSAYVANDAISKTFIDGNHFGIIVPQKL